MSEEHWDMLCSARALRQRRLESLENETHPSGNVSIIQVILACEIIKHQGLDRWVESGREQLSVADCNIHSLLLYVIYIYASPPFSSSS